MGRVEEAVDELLPGGVEVGFGSGDEIVNFLGRGWESDEVVGDAADESGEVGTGGGFLFMCVELGVDEGVDGVSCGGRGGLGERLESPDGFGLITTEGPVISETSGGFDDDAFVGHSFISFREADGFLSVFVGPGGAVFNPGFDVGDLFGIETIVGRHLVVGIVPLDDGHEEGILGVAGDEKVVDEFAAFEVAFAGEEVELALDFIGVVSVAGDAFRGEDGEGVEGRVFVRGGGLGELREGEEGEESHGGFICRRRSLVESGEPKAGAFGYLGGF